MKAETKIDTSAILLLSPPLAKAAAVFFTAAACFKKLFVLSYSYFFLVLCGEKYSKRRTLPNS